MIGKPFTILQSVDSSNNYAMAKAHAHLAGHGATFFAMEQTAGKGQRGNQWLTDVGSNIMLSVVIEPTWLITGQQFQLSAAVALACVDMFADYAGEDTRIKWPNDLFWQNKKAGGILIENVVQGGDWKSSIVGIGINVNQTKFDDNLPNPVSLQQITGKEFDPVELAKELCVCLQERYEQLRHGFDDVYDAFCNHLYGLDELIKFRKGNIVFDAYLRGVTTHGRLVVEKTNGMEESFANGEVSFVK
jgi:BirA family transcriptional regulator, biotin operon repressor / biotin---[acetyl-CoA-carboxylase] ligase